MSRKIASQILALTALTLAAPPADAGALKSMALPILAVCLAASGCKRADDPGKSQATTEHQSSRQTLQILRIEAGDSVPEGWIPENSRDGKIPAANIRGWLDSLPPETAGIVVAQLMGHGFAAIDSKWNLKLDRAIELKVYVESENGTPRFDLTRAVDRGASFDFAKSFPLYGLSENSEAPKSEIHRMLHDLATRDRELKLGQSVISIYLGGLDRLYPTRVRSMETTSLERASTLREYPEVTDAEFHAHIRAEAARLMAEQGAEISKAANVSEHARLRETTEGGITTTEERRTSTTDGVTQTSESAITRDAQTGMEIRRAEAVHSRAPKTGPILKPFFAR